MLIVRAIFEKQMLNIHSYMLLHKKLKFHIHKVMKWIKVEVLQKLPREYKKEHLQRSMA